MATPAAVLNILVTADTAQASANLTKYDRQLAAVNEQSRKGIEARLGASYDPVAFNRYEVALKQAADRAKNRAAFKAELGANYNNAAFNQYQRAVEKSTKSTKEAVTHTNNLSHSIKGLTTSLLAAGGAFYAYETAKNAIESTVELGHATERLTAITGLNIKQASTWIETMKVRGVQTKAVGMAFITLSRNVRTAQDADTAHITKIRDLIAAQKTQRDALEATGASHKKLTALEVAQQAALDKLSGPSTNKAVAAFAELGVSQDTLRSKNTERILLAVADGMSKIEDPTRRAALAQQIFGRGAQGLIPILAQGRQGVEDALAATQRYGAYLPQNVKQLHGAIDAQHNLNLAMDGLKISFATAVLPSLLKGADGLLKFIGQMRSGSGAGGQFATAMKNAFGTVKDVVTTVVTALGGLGNTVKIALIAFSAVKVYEFVNALKAMTIAIATSPLGAFLTVVGLLASALVFLSGRQRTAAETAREVSQAWDAARTAATALDQANLQVVQSKLNVIRADEAQSTAQREVTRLQDAHLTKTPQYKQAEENLAQAKIDSKQASIDLTNATTGQAKAQADSTAKTKAATAATEGQISTDRAAIQRQKDLIDTLTRMGFAQQTNTVGANALKDARSKLSDATQKLSDDTAALNTALNATPKQTLANINLEVDFQSNMAGAINAIAKSIGGTPLSKTPAFAHHFSGGMVTQPGYFAGEEAPAHPEIILATNPAYRQRNIGLFAQAGNMLGIPGFASGGITPTTGREVSGAPPWMAKAAAAWMKPEANSWVTKLADTLKQTLGGIGGSAGGNSQLASLWVSGGGNPAVAAIMAAIAMAESGGRNVVQQGQPYATTGWGLWQITPGNSEPQFGVDQALLIPINNARAAVAKYNSQGLQAWTTYTSGAYKQFLGAVSSSPSAYGGSGGGNMGGLGSYDGLPVASWIIPELAYAQSHGWRGRITSGYRAGFDPHAPSGSEHALTAYPGGAVDFGGMVDPAGLANKLAFMNATAGYSGLRLLPASGFRDDGHMSGTGHYRGGIHGRVRRYARGGVFGRIPHYATGGSFTQTGTATGMSGFQGLAGVAKPGTLTVPSSYVPAAPSSGAFGVVSGMPGLPSMGGAIATTAAGAGQIQGSISGLRAQIAGLEHTYSTLDQYYSLNTDVFVDPNTGELNQPAIDKRLQELDQLILIRQQIFQAWQKVIVLTQRLVASNRAIIARFQKTLAAINTRGLKGNALTTAQRHQTDARTAISKYQGNLTTALGDLTSAGSDRDNAWLSLLTTQNERVGVAGTQAQPTVAAGAGAAATTTTGTTDTSALLQQMLTTSQQTLAVSQAQYAVLQNTPPFGGSFQSGGVVPGPAGAPRVIVAHGGETVGNTPAVHIHFANGMDWLREFVSIEVQNSTRGQSVGAMRIAGLPGSRGGL